MRRGRAPFLVAVIIATCHFVYSTNAPAAQVALNLMTFNIKGDGGSFGERLGENAWYPLFGNGPARRERALAVIGEYGPDLLSVQELKDNQLADLLGSTQLAGYEYYGVGRETGTTGDRNGVFYRSSRFTRLDQGDFWLSSTPDVPGTVFAGNGSDTGNPRMATWLKLYDNQSHGTYFVLSTHWSLDSLARRQGATLIRSQIEQLAGGLPIVVMGDLNSTQSSSEYGTLIGKSSPTGFQLTSAYRDVFPTTGSQERTFHDWTGATSGSSIDHIFYSTGSVFDAVAANIVHTSYNGKYPSDHFPVTVNLLVTVVPEPSSIVMALLGTALIGLAIARGRHGTLHEDRDRAYFN
ncbi:MAG: endonuclease/exonuclease/phosphatase family protein [Pirellulales bacterium]|nr:endonuclease/exonuclease/phosphatase family protein [Pirellulales bacterium]